MTSNPSSNAIVPDRNKYHEDHQNSKKLASLDLPRSSNPTISKSSLLQIQSQIHELREQLRTLHQLPEIVRGLSQHVNKQILSLTEHYNKIVIELRNRCQDLKIAFVSYEQAKQLEKNRLLQELEGKDETIGNLLQRYEVLQRKYTQKTKQMICEKDLTIEIRNLHKNNNQLVKIIEKYEDQIQKRERMSLLLDRESPNKYYTQRRNDFLRNRYFLFKKENQILKSRLSSLTKSEVKQFKLNTDNTFAGELPNRQFQIQTLPNSPIKHKFISQANSKSRSKGKNKSIQKQKQKQSNRITARGTDQKPNLNKTTKSQMTPKQKVKQLLDNYQKTKQQKKRLNKTNPYEQMKEKLHKNEVIHDFLATLRSV